jgi:hypothetical protein
MKITILGMLLFVFAFNSQAQSKNVQTEVKTTVTTIKDSRGEKKLIKSEVTKEEQKVGVELDKEREGTKNIPMANNPVQVTTATAVNIDGKTKIVDVDHSAYYVYEGKKYQIKSDSSGYDMVFPETNDVARLRRTSNNSYFYVSKNKNAFGYFDANGDFILESYDANTDKVNVEKYTVSR